MIKESVSPPEAPKITTIGESILNLAQSLCVRIEETATKAEQILAPISEKVPNIVLNKEEDLPDYFLYLKNNLLGIEHGLNRINNALDAIQL